MSRVRLLLFALALSLTATATREAAAQRAPGLERALRAQQPPPRRPVPNYDGRAEPPPSVGEVLLWVPRVALSPLYFVSEFVVRRPLGFLISTAEREQWAATLFSLFQFGPHREIAIVPTALLDFGLRPSVGVYARWNDFLFRHNKLRLHAATGGPDWVRVALADRIESSDERREIQLRADYTHRPDGLFYGIALDNLESNRSRYALTRAEVELSLAQRKIWRSSSARAFARVRRLSYSDDTCCDAPLAARIAERSLRGASGAPLPLPPGYVDGATLYAHGAELFVDSRRPRPAAGSGLRIGLYGEYAASTDAGPARRYLRYGVAPEVYWDITGQNRVLHLGLNVQVIDTLRGDVPFSELIDLSDEGPLKGFLPGRVIGPSAAALTLEYEWPIWIWLDGALHFSAGNTFAAGFEDFALDAARLSAGLGIRAPEERDHAFNFLVALGTEPLRDGAAIDSFRLVFGGTRVF